MSELVKELGSAEFAGEIASGVSVVDFWAPWCGPCQMQGMVLRELAEEFKDKVKVMKLNIDEAREIAGQYAVQAIPTIIIFENGRDNSPFIGLQPKRTLLEGIEKPPR